MTSAHQQQHDDNSDQSERMPFRITGEQLRQWRTEVGMSQRELAKRMHYSPGAIADWETGRRPIPYRTDCYRQLLAVMASHGRENGERLNAVVRELVTLGQALW